MGYKPGLTNVREIVARHESSDKSEIFFLPDDGLGRGTDPPHDITNYQCKDGWKRVYYIKPSKYMKHYLNGIHELHCSDREHILLGIAPPDHPGWAKFSLAKARYMYASRAISELSRYFFNDLSLLKSAGTVVKSFTSEWFDESGKLTTVDGTEVFNSASVDKPFVVYQDTPCKLPLNGLYESHPVIPEARLPLQPWGDFYFLMPTPFGSTWSMCHILDGSPTLQFKGWGTWSVDGNRHFTKSELKGLSEGTASPFKQEVYTQTVNFLMAKMYDFLTTFHLTRIA